MPEKPCTSPARPTNLVANQPCRATHRLGGPPADYTRVLLVKGAADALCDPEAGIPRQAHGDATLGAGFGGDPSNHFPQGADHSLPHTSKMSGQKAAPRAATWDAVSCKVRLRVTTSWKTSETGGVAEEMWEVRSKDETERSQASANPDTPQRSRRPRGGVHRSLGARNQHHRGPGGAWGGAGASPTQVKPR